MHTRHVEVAVIGAGTAGMTAYRSAREHTHERRRHRRRALRHHLRARRLHAEQAADRRGRGRARRGACASASACSVEGVRIDGREVMAARAQRARPLRRLRAGGGRAIGPKSDRLRGHARFVDDHTLEVGGHTRLRARRIVIATGSQPGYRPMARNARRPADRQRRRVRLARTCRASVAVIGTGVIGLEIGAGAAPAGRARRASSAAAAASGRSPTRCCIAGAQRPSPRSCRLTLNAARPSPSSAIGDGVRIDCAPPGRERTERFDFVLAATGRAPDLDGLGLENTPLAARPAAACRFRPPHRRRSATRLSSSPATPRDERPLLHEAADDGRIAGDNAGAVPTCACARGARRSSSCSPTRRSRSPARATPS